MAALGAGVGTGGTFGSGESVTFDPQTVTVGEGDGQAVVTVARNACESGSFRLSFRAPRTSTNQSTADENDDYFGVRDSSTWARCDGEGRAERVFTIPIVDDDEPENDENIEMEMWASPTSTMSTNPMPAVDPDGEIVIADNDHLRLTTADVRVREADRVAKVTVQRRRGSRADTGEAMQLRWETLAGSARSGADFGPVKNGSVEIPAGDSGATVEVPIRADGSRESDEDFRVAFSAGELAAQSKVTIADSTKPADKPKPQPQAQQPTIVVPPAVSAPRAQQQSVKGPCISKRRFTVRLKGVARGTVKLGGKRLETRRVNGELRAQVNLRGRLKGRYTLTVKGEDAAGRDVSQTRRYRTCSAKRRR